MTSKDIPVNGQQLVGGIFPSNGFHFFAAVFHQFGGKAGVTQHGADFVGHVARIPKISLEGVLKHFAWGNAWTLDKLRQRFDSGPVDWARLAAEAAAKSKAAGK